MRKRWSGWPPCGVALAAGGCSTTRPWLNEPLTAQETVGYDGLAQLFDASRLPDVLVVAHFSGGGWATLVAYICRRIVGQLGVGDLDARFLDILVQRGLHSQALVGGDGADQVDHHLPDPFSQGVSTLAHSSGVLRWNLSKASVGEAAKPKPRSASDDVNFIVRNSCLPPIVFELIIYTNRINSRLR